MKKAGLLALCVLAATSANAKVTLPHFITDNMVMQQNSTLTVP